jgi:hypothetical protein
MGGTDRRTMPTETQSRCRFQSSDSEDSKLGGHQRKQPKAPTKVPADERILIVCEVAKDITLLISLGKYG